jgi:hypothetical protein
MATVLVRNQLGGLVKHFRLPADVKSAQAFCNEALQGTYQIFQKTGELGSPDGVAEAILVKVYIKDRDTGKHWFLNFYAKPTADKKDVVSALQGWTGADEIVILDWRPMKFVEITG